VSCFHPLPAHRNAESGAVFIGRHLPDRAGESPESLELPCGHCTGCKLDRSRAWSIRCMHEAQLYDSNVFVTLSYEDKFLPKSLSLEYSDFQGFMKRLRRKVPGVSVCPNGSRSVRFFAAGEYGERYRRPHWHAILFNVGFADSVSYCNDTARSALCESLWGRGNVVLGRVTASSAAYVAGYTLSKRYGRSSEEHYEDVVDLATGEVSKRRPEFCQMSRDPGIGAWWYERYARDLFPKDHAVVDGAAWKVPSYYWRKFQDGGLASDVEAVALARRKRARAVPFEENSERRRSDREVVAQSRLKTFSERRH